MTASPVIVRLVAALVGLLLAGASAGAASDASLYDRIGGAPVMQRVTEEMIGRVASDPKVNQSFKGIDVHRLSFKIAAHLCSLTGGTHCTGSEDSVRTIHAGLDITQAEFYAMVESLRIALDDNGVGEREKNELLKILAPYKRDVVTR